MQEVPPRETPIESYISRVAAVAAVIIGVSILTINTQAANAIKDIGFWTGVAYRTVTFFSWALAVALGFIAVSFHKKN